LAMCIINNRNASYDVPLLWYYIIIFYNSIDKPIISFSC
jgi:hypothetical protein